MPLTRPVSHGKGGGGGQFINLHDVEVVRCFLKGRISKNVDFNRLIKNAQMLSTATFWNFRNRLNVCAKDGLYGILYLGRGLLWLRVVFVCTRAGLSDDFLLNLLSLWGRNYS